LAKRKPSRRKQQSAGSELGVRRSSDGRGWVLVHPRAVREMAEDLEEVRAMIEAGEFDVATDELRWLVSNCSELIEAHELLGELAFAAGDPALARGHFGFAVQLGLKTLERAKVQGPEAEAEVQRDARRRRGSPDRTRADRAEDRQAPLDDQAAPLLLARPAGS